jgi:hypothetical protein
MEILYLHFYVDMDNNTIILATKYITDDSKLEKYVYEINKKCSYSDNGRPTCGVDPIKYKKAMIILLYYQAQRLKYI